VTNNTITDDEIRRRLNDVAAQMPLTRAEWHGPTVPLTTEPHLDARRPRRWLAAGVAVAAAATLIGATMLAIGGAGESTTVASQPRIGTTDMAGSAPATTAGASTVPGASSQVQCGSEPRTVGSGVLATERRSVPAGITGVVVRGCAKVTVSQGAPGATVTADDNLLSQITTTADGTSLVIDVASGFSSTSTPSIAVSLETIADLRVEGAAEVTATGAASTALSISISGSGEVTVTGTTSDLDVSIDGAGEVDTTGLTTISTSIEITGAGTVTVASASVTVDISGAGEVTVVTVGASISATITGAGIVFDADGNPIAVGPDVSIPDVSIPDISIPDISIPDISIPDISIPDISIPDISIPDMSIPDVSIPDVSIPDISIPDVSIPDLSSIERDLDAAMVDLETQLAAIDAELQAVFGS
jgi:hypothetical protein